MCLLSCLSLYISTQRVCYLLNDVISVVILCSIDPLRIGAYPIGISLSWKFTSRSICYFECYIPVRLILGDRVFMLFNVKQVLTRFAHQNTIKHAALSNPNLAYH